MEEGSLSTIGHSNHNTYLFIHMLKENNINVVVDVRSTPYSKYVKEYNREDLINLLKGHNINYIFMGDLLGAKIEDDSLLLDNGVLDFNKVTEQEFFKKGIKRVLKGIDKGYNISMMCAEKNALECHRFGLISSYLSNKVTDIEITHIHPTGNKTQKEMEIMLIEKYSKKIDRLGVTTEMSILEQALYLNNLDIGFCHN
jgi:uncharacterized protein (DUF488 family)